MIGGTYGKILHVDLTSGEIHIEYLGDDVYALLCGGRAFVAYYLLRDLPQKVDPFDERNILIFAPGILQSSGLPGSGRSSVGGKSPLTGAIGSSEVGGWWGPEFKKTGFDALVIHGRANSPIYLYISNSKVEILPAGHLWGLETALAEARIRIECGDEQIRVAQIGPAGENRVRYAAIMHDINRAAGRNGLGAVMGSKNLKAVAVRGTLQAPIVNRARVKEVARWLGNNYKELAAWATVGIGRGTQDSLMKWSYLGGLPTHNFRLPIFESAELLSGERNYEMFLKSRDTCRACPISCKQVFEHDDKDPSRRLNSIYGGPEYETMASFGPLCGVKDNFAVSKANELCNAYGLDTISTGASIAFVMECFEEGVLTKSDTGGLDYRWGDVGLVLRSIKMIADREGFGNVMAEGVARMSSRFGPATAPFNLTVKSQELPMHEPRLKHVLGLGYAISPIGADHNNNVHDTDFVNDGAPLRRVNSVHGKRINPLSSKELSEDKLSIFYYELNWMHFQDCALNCHFVPYDYDQLASALSGVTGIEYSPRDILAIGERAQTLSRLFNLREGFTADDDSLPKRVMKAFDKGPLKGVELNDESFNWARKRYYEMMKWNPTNGKPSDECISQLNLNQFLNNISENNT